MMGSGRSIAPRGRNGYPWRSAAIRIRIRISHLATFRFRPLPFSSRHGNGNQAMATQLPGGAASLPTPKVKSADVHGDVRART